MKERLLVTGESVMVTGCGVLKGNRTLQCSPDLADTENHCGHQCFAEYESSQKLVSSKLQLFAKKVPLPLQRMGFSDSQIIFTLRIFLVNP